jgi:succinylglutamate desuccinylase
MKIKRVMVVGGTHGNELIGIQLVKKLEQQTDIAYRPSFKTMTLLANPAAIAKCRRYVEKDLNRSFHSNDLQDLMKSDYETTQARKIVDTFGANGITPVDMVIDLHSTTSNMGLTIIVDDRPFNLRLAAYLSLVKSDVRIYLLTRLSEESNSLPSISLPSIAPLGCTIEVGAVAQGTLDAKLFQETEDLIRLILDYVESYNQNQSPKLPETVTAYRDLGNVAYPKDTLEEIMAMIHPQLHFHDYEPLHPGDPMFITFDGRVILYQGNSTVYPVFINEAAYYEKNIAFCLTEKITISSDELIEV